MCVALKIEQLKRIMSLEMIIEDNISVKAVLWQ